MGRYNKFITEEIMPSKTLRDYYVEHKLDLTENQLIKLAQRIPLEKRIEIFEYILEAPEDEKIATYLVNQIEMEKFRIREMEGPKKDAVYYLYQYVPEDDYDPQEEGIYKQVSTAIRLGTKLGNEFKFERHIVKDLSEDEIQKLEKAAETDDLDDTIDMRAYFNEKGQVTGIEYYPKESDEAYNRLFEIESEFDMYFDNEIYRNFPCPFDNGDYIREVSRGEFGIMHVNPDREKWLENLLSRGIIPEDEEYCEFPDEDGEFCHGHFMSADLERITLEDIPEEMRDLMEAASYLVKGKGSIDDFQYRLMEMNLKKKAKH